MIPDPQLHSDSFESVVAAFESAWRQGGRPMIASFVGDKGTDQCGRLALELVCVDLEYRWRAAQSGAALEEPRGGHPLVEDYRKELPQGTGDSEIPMEAIAEEYRVRHVWGDRPSHAEYHARFPRQGTQLEPLLVSIDLELTVENALDDPASEVTSANRQPSSTPLEFADFFLHELLGAGGMGKVYRATQRSLGRVVAIKALRKSRQTDPVAVEQFLHESQIHESLHHPHIVQLHGVGRFPNGGYFLALDYVDGQDLEQRLRQGPATTPEAIRGIVRVAEALDYAHQQGIVHCDLKPSNILISATGHPLVVDFGLAQLLRTSMQTSPMSLGGTIGYAAPEQFLASRESIGPGTDVFGLGATLYAILTGRPPYDAVVAEDVVNGGAWSQVTSRLFTDNTTLPDSLKSVCYRCLQFTPEDRFTNALEVAAAIQRALA